MLLRLLRCLSVTPRRKSRVLPMANKHGIWSAAASTVSSLSTLFLLFSASCCCDTPAYFLRWPLCCISHCLECLLTRVMAPSLLPSLFSGLGSNITSPSTRHSIPRFHFTSKPNGNNKDHLNENKKSLFRVCCSEGVSHHHLHLAETQRQAEEWESFRMG